MFVTFFAVTTNKRFDFRLYPTFFFHSDKFTTSVTFIQQFLIISATSCSQIGYIKK
uniref:Uncharacterized protein n=1 Tax=uncultured marine virus TaxID=186617 RepID=A0A0F7L9F9_9VIRU|nr:hypothetical protein [uncultured marine virus]